MLQQAKVKIFLVLDRYLYEDLHAAPSYSPRLTLLKWFALFLCCMSTLGGYYCHDAVSPLQTPIMEIIDISTTKFNILFSAYSIPNIIMPLIGGFIVDKLGVKVGLILFASIICVGQAILALGASHLSFNAMIVGTGIMGVGLDALCAAKSTMVVRWFHGQELAFAMGLTLTISRLGSSLSSYLSPWLYAKYLNLATPLIFGIYLGLFSLILITLLCFLDYYAEEKETKFRNEKVTKEKFQIANIKSFQRIFYLIMLNCMLAYGVIKGFLNNANDLMNKRFGFNPQLSGKYLSIVFILATIFSPIFGGIVDRIGRRVIFLIGSFIALALVHIGVLFLKNGEPDNPNFNVIFALIGIGIAFSAYAAVIWPSVSIVVEKNANGTAFGFILAMQNLILSIIPIILGLIHDKTINISYGYYWTEIFLLNLSICGILATVWMKKEDTKTGDRLESAPNMEKDVSFILLKDEKKEIELQNLRTRN